MHQKIHVDYETSSPLDLKKVGAYKYAKDPRTKIICRSSDPKTIPSGPIEVCAHNAEFDILIMEHKEPELYRQVTKVNCSAAMAASLGLPRRLDYVSEALKLTNQKDMVGQKVMKKWSKNRGVPDAKSLATIKRYCDQDVAVEKELDAFLPEFPALEQELFELTLKMNRTGIPLDIPSVKVIMMLVDQKNTMIKKTISQSTSIIGTDLTRPKYLLEHLNTLGVTLPNMQKATLEMALLDLKVTGAARAIIEARLKIGKASLGKYQAMLDRVEEDGRVRGNLLFNGGRTGRWSGMGVQFQNLPRQKVNYKAFEDIHKLSLAQLEAKYGDMHTFAQCMVRGCLCAPEGKELLVFDYGQIEARVLAWLAGQVDILLSFRAGDDVYKVMAAKIYSKNVEDITGKERQLGKVAILALGYQMGWERFKDKCKEFGIYLDDYMARNVVRLFRSENDKIKSFWDCCGWAMRDAIETIGRFYSVSDGRIKFGCCTDEDFIKIFLPSGRALYYYRPRIDPDGMSYMGKSKSGKLDRECGNLYGGKITENIVQAVARDIMAEAMLKLDKAGFNIILTVHDEVICEESTAADRFDEMELIMLEVPTWANGLPLSVEGYRAKRYRK